MKNVFTAIGRIAFFLSLATLASAQTQTPASPPIKMGLWQEEVTTTITGIEGVTATAHKYTEQTCITPESWKHGLQGTNVNRCTISNRHDDARKISYEQRCGAQQEGSTVFHIEILIDSDEHMHGTAVAKISGPASSHEGTWTSTITERYLASDCGDIKPGEKKPE